MKTNLEIKLPSEAKRLFDDIEIGSVLGASNHIKMISKMFGIISENEEDEEAAKSLVNELGQYFIETRGQSSYAIITAIKLIDKYIENASGDCYSERVKNGVAEYFIKSDLNTRKVIEYSSSLLSDCKTILAFDYSSTVEKTLCALEENITVIIPESRVINGGYPFVEPCIKKGHKVHFIPDANVLTVLREVDAIVIGAETFYPDGTAFNTAGSDILAELASIYHVPYYVLTPMLKVDMRASVGKFKKAIIRDVKDELGKNWPQEIKAKIDFSVVELTAIRPELISGYVTEYGILKPSGLLGYLLEGKTAC